MSEPLPETVVRTKTRPKSKRRLLPPYNVILENDDFHTFDFVVEVLQKVLPCNEQRAFQLTELAHRTGRAVIWTGSKEVAELKAEQIQSFHQILPDGKKLGPLGVYIEPTEG
jgi:ATP-dependent Clp protease adaptor protein ClpS